MRDKRSLLDFFPPNHFTFNQALCVIHVAETYIFSELMTIIEWLRELVVTLKFMTSLNDTHIQKKWEDDKPVKKIHMSCIQHQVLFYRRRLWKKSKWIIIVDWNSQKKEANQKKIFESSFWNTINLHIYDHEIQVQHMLKESVVMPIYTILQFTESRSIVANRSICFNLMGFTSATIQE